MKFIPHEYQQHALEYVLDRPYCSLFLEMGLGKTVITLTAVLELLYKRFEAHRVLVIAPLYPAMHTWPQELRLWNHLKPLRMSLVVGREKDRVAALAKPADLYVINRDNLRWLVSRYGRRWPFDMVVIDELSGFKSPSSWRFRALRKVRPYISRIIGLTGTPTPNGLTDLWAEIFLLDQGERLGKTFREYREKYFVAGRRNTQTGVTWVPKPGAEAEIYALIADICMSMREKDWIGLPRYLNRTVPVTLSQHARETYLRMERDLLLPYAGGDVVAATAAVLGNKLLQLANGAVYDEFHAVHEVHDAKLDALEDCVEAAAGSPMIVFYAFIHDAKRILHRLPQARLLEGTKDIDDWNAGRIQVLLAHPASAGHGLNLQFGGRHIVWFSLPWSLELYQQGIGRLHRQGQQQRVIVQHLIAQGTIDEAVRAALGAKSGGQNALLHAVRARIRKAAGGHSSGAPPPPPQEAI